MYNWPLVEDEQLECGSVLRGIYLPIMASGHWTQSEENRGRG